VVDILLIFDETPLFLINESLEWRFAFSRGIFAWPLRFFLKESSKEFGISGISMVLEFLVNFFGSSEYLSHDSVKLFAQLF